MDIALKTLKEDRFLIPIKIIAVYIVWKGFHYLAHIEGTLLCILWAKLCVAVGSGYAAVTSKLLSIGGMNVAHQGININLLISNKQIWVQEHCLAIPAMVVFTGAILFFSGGWKQKLRFIVIGLIGIAIINILRLIFVCLAWVYMDRFFFDLHHSVIYAGLSYGFIFLMIRWWIKNSTPEVEPA